MIDIQSLTAEIRQGKKKKEAARPHLLRRMPIKSNNQQWSTAVASKSHISSHGFDPHLQKIAS